MKYVTINTGAAYCVRSKASGYAFSIVCDLYRLKKGGNFKVPPRGFVAAETYCIGNAAALLMAQKQPDKLQLLIINAPSLMAVQVIQMRSTAWGLEVSDILRKVAKRFGCKIELRQVKPQPGAYAQKSQASAWCEEEANRWMDRERKKIVKKG